MNLLLSLFLLGGFHNPCDRVNETNMGIKIQTGDFGNGECFITVGDSKFRGMVYRNYLFTTDGEIMVFNSLGNGPISTDTGARAFYLRPFRASLGWRFAKNQNLEILLPSGAIATFDSEKADWVELTDGDVMIDEDINRTNNGGVEIQYRNGYVIDSGFRFGGHPTSRMERKSTVAFENGSTCEVENKELWYRDGDEHKWNITNNQEFDEWYNNRCN